MGLEKGQSPGHSQGTYRQGKITEGYQEGEAFNTKIGLTIINDLYISFANFICDVSCDIFNGHRFLIHGGNLTSILMRLELIEGIIITIYMTIMK